MTEPPRPPNAGPWLAVIDMQRVFADPSGAWFTPGFAAIVEPVRTLVAAFGPRVVFTRFVAPAVPTGAWARYYERWPFALQPPDAPMYRLVEGIGADPARTVEATTFHKWTPEVAGRVGDAGRLVLAGVSTDCCVLSTALAAADAGVRVRVVADACAGVTGESHLRALELMAMYAPHIEVVALSEILDAVDGTAEEEGGRSRGEATPSGA